jgi:hypothetical protein
MAEWKVPGLAVAVVHDGAVVVLKAYGQRDIEAGLPVTLDTQFIICSITKTFTATGLALLVDERRLDWARPAATWLGSALAQQKIPDFSLDNKSAWLMISDNLLPPDSGPGPATFDKRYPYVDNRQARRTNSQPTYRVAALTNPILKPWAV